MTTIHIKELNDRYKKISGKKSFFNTTGGLFLIGGSLYYLLNTLGSISYIPETQVCFRAPSINKEKNINKTVCDSNDRVKVLLTPLYQHWADRDVEFSGKIANSGTLKHFTHTLPESKNVAFISLFFGFVGAGCFGMALKLETDNKSLYYRYKQVQGENLAIDSEAARKQYQQAIASEFYIEPTPLQVLMANKQAELELSKIEKEIAENRLAVTETSLRIEGIKSGDIKQLNAEVKQDLPVFKGIEWFNWEWFRTKSSEEDIPHIRVVASTGCGKSTLISWLMQFMLVGSNEVYTPKADRNKFLWGNLEVLGTPEKWDVIKSGLDRIVSLRSERNQQIHEDPDNSDFEICNFLFDESKDTREGMGTYFQNALIASSEEPPTVAKLKEAKKTGISFYEETIRTTLRQARAARVRLILTALSQYVGTWGLAGESDLVDCFCTVYMGTHAQDEIEKFVYSKPSLSDEEKEEICGYMRKQGKRAAFIETTFGRFLAVVPDIKFDKIEDR
jgi:hypothetical protein